MTAYVESPTFGASSWLAHLSLISGVEVRDQYAYTSLMASSRETMITNFARRGYRTVALMPGMRQAWPEGAFYHYDQIYGRDLLEYRGTGVRLVEHSRSVRAREDRCARTESSDAEAAVRRLSDEHDARAVRAGCSVSAGLVENAGLRCVRQRPTSSVRWPPTPDLTNLRPSYTHAMAYEYATIAGYLRQHPRDSMVVDCASAIISRRRPSAVAARHGACPFTSLAGADRFSIVSSDAASAPGSSRIVHRSARCTRSRRCFSKRSAVRRPTPHRLATQSPVASATQYQPQTTRPAPPE